MNGHSSQNGNGHSAQNGNGHSAQNGTSGRRSNSVHSHEADMSAQEKELLNLTLQLRDKKKQDEKYAKFHGDKLIGNPTVPKLGLWNDFKTIFSRRDTVAALGRSIEGLVTGRGLDAQSVATIGGNLSDYSTARNNLINSQVKDKYDRMLHPPLTYLGDAFQYRTADGKFNSAINPHLGQAGAPYAKTVPSQTAPLGALPDPADLFDKLMARQEGGRQSQSGLSSMLVYHATIIIHDIFRTNDNDKNISDSSSYLDLSPLYGYADDMQRKIRDDKFMLGLLKPDTFAEDRLLRQPPGVCIMLVMYNRYHNYAARQLLRINENGRFSVPVMYEKTQLVSLIKAFMSPLSLEVEKKCKRYEKIWRDCRSARPRDPPSAPKKLPDETPPEKDDRLKAEQAKKDAEVAMAAFESSDLNKELLSLTKELEKLISDKAQGIRGQDPTFQSNNDAAEFEARCDKFKEAWQAAWKKQDDDLFNTARLITCGMYIQISVHDYLRALMGFHQFDTNFTLDPRADFDQKKTSRGIGNQVTVEFNLLYRFHCAISLKDEAYTEEYMENVLGFPDAKNTPLPTFLGIMGGLGAQKARDKKREKPETQPWEVTFGIPQKQAVPTNGGGAESSGNSSDSGIGFNRSATATSKATNATTDKPKYKNFTRNTITNLFNDQDMLDELTSAMDEPISNFGPRNVPLCLKPVEIMGILQARKWECGTLNDFRDFFGLPRHASFDSVTKNPEIQNALRDLYEHPDKIELYPGIFCESDEHMGLDPGPSESSSALWSAIFSDAITLVRSDRFYTVDWNTNSLTSWGMKEVTPNNEICKSSVFHRLLQRAFPGWFPSNTIRFFHPFYTAEQNAKYAKAQGYDQLFKETIKPPKGEAMEKPVVSKPEKPEYLIKFDDIQQVLNDSNNFINPAYYYQDNLPTAVKDVLKPEKDKKPPEPSTKINDYVKDSKEDLQKYLDDLMKKMIKRESISMTNSTFQVDATRDFAIPVVTHYVAEFLGFGDKLCKDPSQTKGVYSENEIYQHITNCQAFLTYNADETKWMQRRRAFKDSMEALMDLAQKGTIWEAGQWDITMALFGKKKTTAMHDLGVFIAKEVLAYENDQRKSAAILLLVCLDFAYNAVVSFTATLDGFMKDLYAAADGRPKFIIGPGQANDMPRWVQAQKHIFSDAKTADEQKKEDELFDKLVQEMVRITVRQPIWRKAVKGGEYTFDGNETTIKDGQAIVLDLAKATDEVSTDAAKKTFLTSQLGIADKFGVFSPRSFATISLTSMIRFIAQMKNPRRGHDTQGMLKKINLDYTPEGYANYMAPGRVNWIERQVRNMDNSNKADKIFNPRVLKPQTDTYLTPTWDEFVPFPMTWKIRFDGFGESNYKTEDGPYGRVKTTSTLPDYLPPWYQPKGPSADGGAFAGTVCVCAAEAYEEIKHGGNGGETHAHYCPCVGGKKRKSAQKTTPLTTGCGMNDNYK